VALSIDEVTLIARTVASRTSPALDVSGVTLGGGEGSEYVEILVLIDGCETPPCRVSIGTFRHLDPSRLERDIARDLRKHLRERGEHP
jgi:hypothetical protein